MLYDCEAFYASVFEIEEDPDYEIKSDILADRFYYSQSDTDLYYDQIDSRFQAWLRSELNHAEKLCWKHEGAAADYYAARDKREQEIMQLIGTPYDYYLTLFNNDTEYCKEWYRSSKLTTKTENGL